MLNLEFIEDRPFGAIVPNVDCADLGSETALHIRTALFEHQLLIFPGQAHLDPADEVRFYRAVDTDADTIWRDQQHNPWEQFKVEQGNTAGTYQIPDEPGVLVLGKGEVDHFGLKVTLGGSRDAYGEDEGSQVLGGGALQWHIDGTFYHQEPCVLTQMRCVEAPTGPGHWLPYNDGTEAALWCAAGATAFASGRVAFDWLSVEDRHHALALRVHYLPKPFQSTYALGNSDNGLRVIDPEAEKLFHDGRELPGKPASDLCAKVYPLVWTCDETGKKALMPHPRCMAHLEDTVSGRHVGTTESRLLVEVLMRPAIDPDQVYVHTWRSGDLVIWNNRSMWHSATGRLGKADRRIQHLTAFNSRCVPV